MVSVTSDQISGSPAIASDGTIYIGDHWGQLHAFDPVGVEKWSFQATSGSSAIRATPAIAKDGTIYIGSQNGFLYAITPAGKEKWRFDAGGPIHVSANIASDGTVYIPVFTARKLLAVNANGTLKWSFVPPFGANFDYYYAVPAIGSDGTVYVSTYNPDKLYALRPDGTVKWTRDFTMRSPTVGMTGAVFAGGGGGIQAIDGQGNAIWKITTGWVPEYVSIGKDGTIYAGISDAFYAFNANGTVKWGTNTTDNFAYSPPTIAADGTVYAGTTNTGELHAFSSNGTVKWKLDLGDGIRSGGAIGTDGTLYFASFDGKLYAIN